MLSSGNLLRVCSVSSSRSLIGDTEEYGPLYRFVGFSACYQPDVKLLIMALWAWWSSQFSVWPAVCPFSTYLLNFQMRMLQKMVSKALLRRKYIYIYTLTPFIYVRNLFPSSTKLVHSIVESNLVGQTWFAVGNSVLTVSDVSVCPLCAWKWIPRGGLHDLSTNRIKADGIILAFSRRGIC